MFRETVVKGRRTGGEGGKGRADGNDGDNGDDGKDGEDWGGGSANNVRIDGVAQSSVRLGNRLGELKGETSVSDCWKLTERGDTGGDDGMVNGLADGGVPQIVLR
jgi:hypothetical protein